MKSYTAATFAAAFALLVPALSHAQDGQPTQPAPAVGSSCRLGDHEGFEDADSRTALQVVCAEIARAGAPAGARYRVSLGKLGSAVILSVAREGDTPGSTADSREMRLQGVEEVVVAAPRVAESIVKGTPLVETEKVDNLVGQETRQPKSKPGKTHFALGIVGILPPLDQGLTPAPGIVFDVHYETGSQNFELGGTIRFGSNGGGSDAAQTSGFFAFSLGGRGYTSDADISPYVGGGMSWSYFSVHAPAGLIDASGSGLGAYADAGVEILRTHHAHLALGARMDVPFFTLRNSVSVVEAAPVGQPIVGTGSATGPSTLYYVPLSAELRLTF
jgi:hypothetical protein